MSQDPLVSVIMPVFDRAHCVMDAVHSVLDPKTLSEWMLEDSMPARLQLQLHKYIWSPHARGV